MRARFEGRTPKTHAPAERRGLPVPNKGQYWSKLDLDQYLPVAREPVGSDVPGVCGVARGLRWAPHSPCPVRAGPQYDVKPVVGTGPAKSFLGKGISRSPPTASRGVSPLPAPPRPPPPLPPTPHRSCVCVCRCPARVRTRLSGLAVPQGPAPWWVRVPGSTAGTRCVVHACDECSMSVRRLVCSQGVPGPGSYQLPE